MRSIAAGSCASSNSSLKAISISSAVWGTGDVSEKPVGFTDVRVKVDMECDGVPPEEIDALITHVKKWSPVANTFTRPVGLEVSR